MKIAHINAGVRGIASYALNIYKYFTQYESDVDTLVVSARKWIKQPIPVYEPRSVLVANILPWVIRPEEVLHKLKEYSPDILHNHHPAGTLEFSVGKFKETLDVPMLTTIHMSVGSNRYIVDRVMHALFMAVRANVRKSDVYVAISRFVRDQLVEIGGLPPERVVLLYAGIDGEVFKPVEKNQSDYLELTFCGQIMPEKGIDLLVDVVYELNRSGDRKVRLNIVGEGNLEPMLRAKTRGNPAFNWIGYVNGPAEVARWYSFADAVVLPTRWDEAFSYVPLEAMGSGSPVIASRTGGNTEIVFEGRTGWHFSPSNRSDLYKVIRTLDKARCRDMGLLGREHILEKHTLQTFGRKYSGLYRNMLDRPNRIEQID